MDVMWKELIKQEMKKEYMIKLQQFVIDRRKEINVLPAGDEVLAAFRYVKWDNL